MGLLDDTIKDVKDIKRTNIPEPKSTFETKEFKKEIEVAKEKDKKVIKSSSIRVDKIIQLKLATLVNLDKGDTINDLIGELVDEFIFAKLSKQERDNFELMMDVFKAKAGIK